MRQETVPAFDTVHAACAPDLLQQAYLLTGSHRRAARSVRRAFAAAWPRWRQVAAEPDPAAWLRARAFDHALAPWRPHLPRPHRPSSRQPAPVPGPEDPAGRDRALLAAFGRLSAPRRRAVLLHDALGLEPVEIAAECESSSPTAAARVAAGRAELARLVPALVGTDPTAPEFGERLGGLLHRAAERSCPPAGPRPTRLLRATGRLRALAVPTACALLVLATAGAIGTRLTGHPPVPPAPCAAGCPEQSAPEH
ncbi:sigma factor-like helix-turn-helix DNA-binding protein [Kitasatospora viridis]|uniref:DNA-directed RNA polymerase specialized sigma24 family protein n=1 Tax=Kitasatospora viridis TaxID=281105 RepID=A0A561UJL5_9ACTN|nr:sigma factor-like helix-turn-helix DNA-binding protein [Kitasatospora viridis]TWF99561.1 DNA-directed RNA polymerase specialized sigma24 family protein [Kitasatospora viridis]